jgi:hypothetical protein
MPEFITSGSIQKLAMALSTYADHYKYIQNAGWKHKNKTTQGIYVLIEDIKMNLTKVGCESVNYGSSINDTDYTQEFNSNTLPESCWISK